MLTDFEIFFTIGLNRDHYNEQIIKSPSHLKGVDTLPCEM